MASAAAPSSVLAAQARRLYCDQVGRTMSRAVRAIVDRLREQCTQVGTPEIMLRRRDLLTDLPRQAGLWQQGFVAQMAAMLSGHPLQAAGAQRTATKLGELALVEDATIDLEILVSRMALAMMDKASWEFSDLRYRMSALDRRDEMDPHDVLRPHALARAAVDSWRAAGLSVDGWRLVQPLLHEEFAALVHEAYHETNRWLIGQGVCPEVNLRQFIRAQPRCRPGSATPRGRHWRLWWRRRCCWRRPHVRRWQGPRGYRGWWRWCSGGCPVLRAARRALSLAAQPAGPPRRCQLPGHDPRERPPVRTDRDGRAGAGIGQLRRLAFRAWGGGRGGGE